MPPVIVDAFHSGMRVVRVGEGRIDHEWIELANVPQTLEQIFVTRERRPSTRHAALDLVMGLPSTPPGGPARLDWRAIYRSHAQGSKRVRNSQL